MNTITSRRRFLKATSAFIAGLPLGLPAVQGWAAQPPSSRYSIALIGTGRQGRGLLGNFMRWPNVQIVAVCDVDKTRREDQRQRVDKFYSDKGQAEPCAVFTDFEELLARKDIDAVIIATPDHWHAYQAVAACKAGKDIYCEKPLSLTIAEGRAMVNATRKYNRVFQTGSMQRSSKEFRTACELVRNGRIGKIEKILVDVGGPSKPCDLPEEQMEPGLDWDHWLGPAPVRPYNSVLSPRGVHEHYPLWRSYIEYSGGGMTDWGAHHFDIVQWALDMDNSGPVEIIPPEKPDAQKGVRYIYANGVEVVHQTCGGILFQGTEGKILVNRGKLEVTPQSALDNPLPSDAVRLYESSNHVKDFLDCMGTRKRPICDVEIGCRSVTVCHLGNLAYWHHRKLKWDPAKELFVNDKEANTWLDRPKRGKWKV